MVGKSVTNTSSKELSLKLMLVHGVSLLALMPKEFNRELTLASGLSLTCKLGELNLESRVDSV